MIVFIDCLIVKTEATSMMVDKIVIDADSITLTLKIQVERSWKKTFLYRFYNRSFSIFQKLSTNSSTYNKIQ